MCVVWCSIYICKWYVNIVNILCGHNSLWTLWWWWWWRWWEQCQMRKTDWLFSYQSVLLQPHRRRHRHHHHYGSDPHRIGLCFFIMSLVVNATIQRIGACFCLWQAYVTGAGFSTHFVYSRWHWLHQQAQVVTYVCLYFKGILYLC